MGAVRRQNHLPLVGGIMHLTYHENDGHTKADRPSEIEVTPEMIASGSDVMEKYYLGDNRYCVDSEGLAAIFLAMYRAMILEPALPTAQIRS
jgi:hypothetical protein